MATVEQSPAAQPMTLQSIWTDLSRQLSYIFFNRAPSADPVTAPGSEPGVITVDPRFSSNNGFEVTHEVSTAPKYGTVTWDEESGQYFYTVDSSLVKPGMIDSFVVTVNNGEAAALPGFAGVVQDWVHSFAVNIGLSQPDTAEIVVDIAVAGEDGFKGKYGKPGNSIYWTQQHYGDCMLMASAMAVSQVTQTIPPPDVEATWVGWARTTPSVAQPGAMMYLDETDVTNGVATKDAIVLMEEHFNVTATQTRYGSVDEAGERIPATAKDGQVALRDLQAALARGDATIVAVNSAVVWTAVPNQGAEPFPNYVDADHAIVVTAVDME
ncbi:MAG: hypothetical protein ACTS5I_17360, partial [Rhodanobacter sp.]